MGTKIRNKYELQLDNWKNKAKERGAELRSNNKRIKEIEKSRDLNRARWQKECKLRKADKAALKKLQQSKQKLKHHSYDLESVAICLAVKGSGNVSLRTCRSMLVTMCFLFDITFKVPCINRLRNWEQKSGYYQNY